MAAWTAVDLWDVAKQLGPLAKNILGDWDEALKIRPDLTTFNKDGSVKEILDYKFGDDTWRNVSARPTTGSPPT
jgi:hypothetical protein